MDAARYARIRDLFLATDELPAEQQREFLSAQAGDDRQLIQEVLSLLAEHDPISARLEGDHARPLGSPPPAGTPVLPRKSADASPTPPSSGSGSHQQTTRRGQDAAGAQITRHGAQRTHASPRYKREGAAGRSRGKPSFWDRRARRNRRWNSGWLWLAAVLPTALTGFWTYGKVVASLEATVSKGLGGVANSVTLSVQNFLDDRSHLVESWSRQPAIRNAIIELVAIGREDDAVPKLKAAPQTELISRQLQELSGFDEVKFVVWNREGTILASWLADHADVGSPVAPSGAANLARVFRGERVLFGPERLTDTGTGFVPETDDPVMANIVPIENEDGNIVAVLLVRGLNTFQQFDRLFREASQADLDAYAVDRRGVMLTASPRAVALASHVGIERKPDQIAAKLRVSDPGARLGPDSIGSIRRHALPLTLAAAGATSGHADIRIEPYNNYAGIPVVGAWRWNDDWQIGVIVEQDYQAAFNPAGIVRIAFLFLGVLLTLTAFAAATQIARQSARAHAAIHPLARYELIGELGSGGMGVVYRARHRQLGRDVALKVLRGDRQHREDRLRFDREARLAASMNSPHSVMIYDYGHSDDGEGFCVMELLKGITLYEIVMRDGPQPFGRVLFVLRQICDALAEAHSLGLLHRDIKPQNVMLSLDPAVGDWAVVFDFGLAKSVAPEADVYQTAETVWAGTPMYMAPERYRDPAGMDPRSDIYSVGCIAYFLLSGRPPYIECDPESLFALVLSEQPISMSVHRDQPVPAALVKLVDKCMAKSVDHRYESVEKLSRELDQLRAEFPWSADDAREWWKIHGYDA